MPKGRPSAQYRRQRKMEKMEKPKKKRKLWLIIPLVIVVLALAAVLVVYGMFHQRYVQIYEPETTPPVMVTVLFDVNSKSLVI